MSEVKFNPEGKVALVSGANRGIGRAIVVELIKRGIGKVYAGARNIDSLHDLVSDYGDKVVPVELDVTKQETIDQLVQKADNLDILVNNAGVFSIGSIFSEHAESSLEENLNINVWGLMRLTIAFGKQFQSEDAKAIINVSSLAGLGNMAFGATYSVSKAAVHSMTQGMRAELLPFKTLVMGVYPGPIDTRLTKGIEMDKDSPENVAVNVVNGIENGTEDVFPDMMSAQVGQFYASNPKGVEQQFANMKI